MTAKLQIIAPSLELITSVEEWFTAAPPMGGVLHWKDGRSAKELAKAWCGTGTPAPPRELLMLLASSPPFASFEVTLALPEHVTHFDAFPGGARNHDLLLVLRRHDESVVMGIEAKAGEPLDATLIAKHQRAMEQRKQGATTNLPERIEALVETLFGKRLGEHVGLGTLRYQLLTAAAGTLVEAQRKRATAALLVIHEFGGAKDATALSLVQVEVSAFVAAFAPHLDPSHRTGILYGPLKVHGGGLIPADIPLYIGVIRSAPLVE